MFAAAASAAAAPPAGLNLLPQFKLLCPTVERQVIGNLPARCPRIERSHQARGGGGTTLHRARRRKRVLHITYVLTNKIHCDSPVQKLNWRRFIQSNQQGGRCSCWVVWRRQTSSAKYRNTLEWCEIASPAGHQRVSLGRKDRHKRRVSKKKRKPPSDQKGSKDGGERVKSTQANEITHWLVHPGVQRMLVTDDSMRARAVSNPAWVGPATVDHRQMPPFFHGLPTQGSDKPRYLTKDAREFEHNRGVNMTHGQVASPRLHDELVS